MLKTEKGSTLVFALIILGFLLVASLSIAAVSVVDKKSVLTSEKSNIAFQVADSGVEMTLQKIYKGNSGVAYSTLDDLSGNSCDSGTRTITGGINSGTYEISFYESDKVTKIKCNDIDWRKKVDRIKSEGTYGNTRRAIEVMIAPAP